MPRPKPNVKKLYEELLGNTRYEIVEGLEEATNIMDLFKVRCKNNPEHVFTTSIFTIKKQAKRLETGCPHCERETRDQKKGISHEVVQKWATENKYEILYPKPFYKRDRNTLKIKCLECGEKHEIKALAHWEKTKPPRPCVYCAIYNPISSEEFLEKVEMINSVFTVDIKLEEPILNAIPTDKVMNKLRDVWHIKEYNGTKHKGTFICKVCGYEHFTLPNGVGNCLGCSKNRVREDVCKKFKEACKKHNVYPRNNKPYIGLENILELQCNACGEEFETTWKRVNGCYGKILCPHCFKQSGTSVAEQEIYKYVQSIYQGEVLLHDRKILKPKELDILIPELKIAIEYCGNRWHCEKYTEKNTHYEKYTDCLKDGVTLFTIFEDEWEDCQEVVKSVLLAKISGQCEKIYAKNCSVKEINKETFKTFTNTNHLQGTCVTDFRIGVFNDSELVAVCGFRDSNIYDYELVRYCNKLGTSVVGGSGKCIKCFQRKFDNEISIVSFSDNRWSSGKMYEQLGFEFDGNIPKRYFWVGDVTNWKRKHRFTYNKQAMQKKFPNVDMNCTEDVIGAQNGLYRLWDCGYKRFVLGKKENNKNLG